VITYSAQPSAYYSSATAINIISSIVLYWHQAMVKFFRFWSLAIWLMILMK
jgi:hypothetical protein